MLECCGEPLSYRFYIIILKGTKYKTCFPTQPQCLLCSLWCKRQAGLGLEHNGLGSRSRQKRSPTNALQALESCLEDFGSVREISPPLSLN